MKTKTNLLTVGFSLCIVSAYGAGTPPAFTSQPVDTNAVNGGSASFKATVTGTTPITYQWRFNGAALPSATNVQLTLTNIQLGQAGFYSLTLSNPYGFVISSNAMLTVNEKASIATQPQGASVISGDTVSFSVVARGTPLLRYQWFFNGNTLVGATNADLILTSVPKTAQGKYKVAVYNAYGNQNSVEVSLSVYGKPVITDQPEEAHAIAPGAGTGSGDMVAKFSVGASGDDLRYRWFHDGIELAGQTNSTLTLPMVAVADAGQYWAEAANAAGAVASQAAMLTVLGITQPPQSQITAVGANVGLWVVATGPDLRYQWTRNGDLIPGATGPSLNFSGVSAASSGAYQVIVFNSWGLVKSLSAVLQIVSPTLPLADNFANRGLITTASGYGIGLTRDATKETGEPHPCNGRVGKSVWLTWVAPADGIAVFDTSGSAFDTVLGVYTGTSLSSLVEVASDDDSAGYHASRVMFNVLAGSAYQIYVGSLDKDGGELVLGWELHATAYPLPVSISTPANLTTRRGTPATLCIQFTAATPLAIQWYRNGELIPGANQTCLQWSQLTEADLGTYQVVLISPEWTFFLKPWEIQFNSEGIATAGARNKLFDAVNSGLLSLTGP